MAIRINYSKCYNNNDNQIGKSNKIDGVSIDLKNITYTEENINSYEYNIDNKTFYTTDYESSPTVIGAAPKQRSWFYTRITLTLSYEDYPNLINATNINIPEEDIIKTGTKKYRQTESFLTAKGYPNQNIPIYDESFFNNATVQNIVEEKTQDNEISYSEVVNELNDTYSFTGSRVGSATTKWTYEKKDTYMIIYIDIVTKMQVYQARLGWILINWIEDNIEYDYDTVKFNIEYTAPNIQTFDEGTIYGSETGNVTSFSSDLFVNGNTISGLDYSYYFAQSELEEFGNGKNILSLTLPVGNFEVDYNVTDILNINDKCHVEIPIGKDWIVLANNFGFESSFSPVPHVFTVNGLSNRYRTNFTGRIYWNTSNTSYVDFSDSEFPLVMTSTSIVNDEIEVTHRYIFSIIENGIMVTSESDNPDISPPYADIFGLHCENCEIKQYKTISTPLDTDEYGNSQLYKTIYTNLSYTDGFLLEDVKLEPIYNNEQNSIFTHTNNIITGIKDEYKSSTNILNIPVKIDDDYITEIGENFVKENYNIEKITIPYSVSKIGSGAFSYTEGVRTPIDLPDSLVEIDNYAFNFSNISGDLIIPEGVTKIGHYCFADCKKLDGILSIPSTYKFPSSDGDYQFYNVSNLKRIVIYSDAIQTNFDITAFNNTGSCDIYVLDNLVETFKQKMPDVNPDRIKSINSMT